jgi:hypothetical protein
MVERVTRYLLEVYDPDEALEFATRAVLDSRVKDQPAMVLEWERVIKTLRDAERVAEILRDLKHVTVGCD